VAKDEKTRENGKRRKTKEKGGEGHRSGPVLRQHRNERLGHTIQRGIKSAIVPEGTSFDQALQVLLDNCRGRVELLESPARRKVNAKTWGHYIGLRWTMGKVVPEIFI